MRHFVIGAAFCVLGAVPALADQVTLPFTDAMAAFSGLTALTTYPDVVKDGGQDKVVQRAYDLTPNMRLTLAHDISALRTVMSDGLSAQDAIRKVIAADPKLTTPQQREDALASQLLATGRAPVTVDITRFAIADLRLDQNKAITGLMLSQLAPLISGDTAADAAKR